MVELNIGILSVCLPTYRPLFHRKKGSSNGSGRDAEKGNSLGSDIIDPSIQSLGLDLQQSRSNPSHSKDFRHLGVLGDEHVHGVEEEEEEEVTDSY